MRLAMKAESNPCNALSVVVLELLEVVSLLLPVLDAAAGDGVIVLEREVPERIAYREGAPGPAVWVDVSPDDKVGQALSTQLVGYRSTELGDAEFASITTGSSLASNGLAGHGSSIGLSDARFGSYDMNGAGGVSGAVQLIVPVVVGSFGGAVGGATGRVGGTVTGVLNGLTDAIMRTGAQ
jgi:hypothetical protein